MFFFRALGEPLDQDSVPVGQSLNIHQSINQSIISVQQEHTSAITVNENVAQWEPENSSKMKSATLQFYEKF